MITKDQIIDIQNRIYTIKKDGIGEWGSEFIQIDDRWCIVITEDQLKLRDLKKVDKGGNIHPYAVCKDVYVCSNRNLDKLIKYIENH